MPELFPVIHSASVPHPPFLFKLQSSNQLKECSKVTLLFCLATIGIMEHPRSELYIFYLDDCTLGGTVETVLHDLQLVEQEAGQLGLHLNHSK